MQTLIDEIRDLFSQAMAGALPELSQGIDPIIAAAGKPEFGDFQANFALKLAKTLGKNPRDIAGLVIEQLKDNKRFAKLTVSGPGFINIRLDESYITEKLALLGHDKSFSFMRTSAPQSIVVDYGGANVAKEMHVGHLRSTIIGDGIVRILNLLGHKVTRKNHLGDWGTQFGMLIEHLLATHADDLPNLNISDLDSLYKASKQQFDHDPDFAIRAKQRVVALQSGDEQTLNIWKALVKITNQHIQTVYTNLGVLLTEKDNFGESYYNKTLPDIVADMLDRDIAKVDDGATVIFLDGFVDKNKKPVPFMIQKSDGGYLYGTTDMAAAKHRLETYRAQRLIYVTDARQKQHFAMLFAALQKTGWLTENTQLNHVAFGAILGKDKKPFKTREGKSIKLESLLDEAIKRAQAVIGSKNPNLNPDEQQSIAKAIGIGAIKYADLSHDRDRDYVFDWDKMLAFDGNTAPYLQNANVRIHAIFRKAGLTTIPQAIIQLSTLHEHTLALKLLAFHSTLEDVADSLYLHKLCNYLYDLASLFHSFYEHCRILDQDEPIKLSRLQLCMLTSQVLEKGLSLLGIAAIEKM